MLDFVVCTLSHRQQDAKPVLEPVTLCTVGFEREIILMTLWAGTRRNLRKTRLGSEGQINGGLWTGEI